MLGLSRIHRSAWIALLAGAGGCQMLNPAFGLDPVTDGGSDSDGSTAGVSASAAPTEPVLTTSSDPTGTTDPGTTASSEPSVTTTGVDTDDTGVDPSVPASCGNGIPEAGEECDDGDGVDGNDCTNACEAAVCGDGIVHAGVEQCDAGGQPSDACNQGCTFFICGDGNLDPGEACDDGNAELFDGCTPGCQLTCNDGVFEPDREECDPSVVPFANFLGLCSEECELETCFRMTNTGDQDFVEPGWFDDCAEADGERIAVLLRDQQGVKYLQAGKKTGFGEWGPDHMTSTAQPGEQWKLGKHDRKVPLADLLVDNPDPGPEFDVLYAFGADTAPKMIDAAMCPSSLGDGYALAIVPNTDPTKARVLLMPFEGGSMARNLGGWLAAGPAVELAFSGEPMALCAANDPLVPFLGTVAIAVF